MSARPSAPGCRRISSRSIARRISSPPIFVVNRISTQLYEQIQTYAAFDETAMRGLGSVQAKEFNLVLHDLARDKILDIVDADAIAADLGMAHHLPDGVHASGTLYGEIRAELMRLAGFSRS
jgi:hypothetical protein